ncbi:methyl-accepting chemotaxis protein [Cyanobacterium aponinum UTEX 3221]|uniref:HAMP domain-containing protein n=1 Tax=Cyanobacterium aponinum 0216 TaxID=2676140 RepID=A0A844GY53_9CHRO|nr:methyl-accepting chemotaxis protein [Cyanobacterium aponinum]MTF39982.1 HAMP domain-containing protein [Cyanobacterium aponinum 0216]WRL40106.1 methyl-accepting chemotaxis protein [Cyanobacterium aponinum UTEX 3221]
MVSETDYQERFKQARTAYLEGDLAEASFITDGIMDDYPDDPSAFLLKGHIHLRQQEYDLAQVNYQKVLDLTDHQDLVTLAKQGLAEIEEDSEDQSLYPPEVEEPDFDDEVEEIGDDDDDNWTSSIQFDSIDWDIDDLEEEEIEDPTLQQNSPFDQSFSKNSNNPPPTLSKSEKRTEQKKSGDDDEQDEDDTAANFIDPSLDENNFDDDINLDSASNDLLSFDFDNADIDYEQFESDSNDEDLNQDEMQDTGAPTFVVSSEDEPELSDLEQMLTGETGFLNDLDDDLGDYSSQLEPLTAGKTSTNTGLNLEDDNMPLVPEGEEDLFFAPDELDDIPDIDADELPVSSIFTKDNKPEQIFPNVIETDENVFDSDFDNEITGSFSFDTDKINLDLEEDISVSSSLGDISGISSSIAINPEVEVPQGKLAKYYNFSLFTKQLVHGGVTGVVTFVIVLMVSLFQGGVKNIENTSVTTTESGGETTEQTQETRETQEIPLPFSRTLLLSLIAGISGGASTIAMGYLMTNHIKRYTNDLQNHFESIYQGDYEIKATVYSQDEFGTLAAGFNQMTKMIYTTTTEARKRAEETERAREDLQRQVIRLLDDVEGASRGDLTVQAEVTADVLGAVADAFNVTITNLRKIVKQVQQAAVQVNKASTDSEVFARNQSSDALRMAEELAVTLNSVQMMTDSIQRVAENAREAEEVARSSSVTALKGGDAVERTVAGILQIRETVSETTRKVKRLAEASQQISTIVAVISQISSRTNLLALNASIQAARAGEAGRGFAIVADEVRQLADRSAKSLQEIEQIVLQIQTETGSVMTAMEEGIQQVRDVTERSEQAKRALEDIIQVSNRIDALVRSITADTDEQRENSRGVAKVMQAVELTAQATSQESQRVAGSLQNLVGIAKDLISSVERFRVDD